MLYAYKEEVSLQIRTELCQALVTHGESSLFQPDSIVSRNLNIPGVYSKSLCGDCNHPSTIHLPAPTPKNLEYNAGYLCTYRQTQSVVLFFEERRFCRNAVFPSK